MEELEIVLNEESNEELISLEEENNEVEINLEEEINSGSNDYNKQINKPSINGVELVGNKTTKDLGIEDIELIPNIYPESIEKDLKPNQVYNGNAIHDLARLFGMTLEELTKTLPNIIKEFDIEDTYQDEDVYNANAIHQLMEIFGYEIVNIQEEVESYSERISALETIASELEEI